MKMRVRKRLGQPMPQRLEGLTPAPAEADVDEGLEETFPASDPVSVSITRIEKKPSGDRQEPT